MPYKLIALTPSGLKFITNSQKIDDLQRIANNLGAESFTIEKNGSIVYAQRAGL